eukprot:CAMPEP_0197836878 /NCGR_PEP_ID=MMETSP1437-20131217/30368_1 /TAXON_ID=49252 ORGANISM="Eucampia antarctica, Strain CCMP1452" /NCGR_SAMPLE_ID=MMETSP1437 /ASSEMBLY_ACC=CAM_ASM_001096 /LENGTH=599 /DNA_ID=CAMNT_0043443425 /DNA_START=12 /DNA_END=1811 /DNA_ORIENTATION=+
MKVAMKRKGIEDKDASGNNGEDVIGSGGWQVADESALANRRKKKMISSPGLAAAAGGGGGSSLSMSSMGMKKKKLEDMKRKRSKHYNNGMKNLNSDFETFVKNMSQDNNSDDLDKIDLRPNLELYAIAAGNLERRYLRQTGNTLAMCGSGDCGQLGLTEEKMDASRPHPIKKGLLDDDDDDEDAIIDVACGGLHNLALTQSGNVYSFGCNDDGSVGVLDSEGTAFEPVLVSKGKLGLFHPDSKIYNEPIMQVATGNCQSVALSIKGNIYFWGSYKDKEGKQFRDLTPDNDSRDWKGKNIFHKVTILPPHGAQMIPVQVCSSAIQKNRPVHVECGNSFNAVLLDNGQLLTWGIGECGEMSRTLRPLKTTDGEYDNDALIRDYLTPRPVIFATPNNLFAQTVTSVACGDFHMLVTTQDVTNNNNDSSDTTVNLATYSCGLNNYGQLGHGDTKPRSELTRIEALKRCKIIAVAAGTHHSMCLDVSGKYLYTFGRGDSGQLGITDELPEVGFYSDTPVSVFLNSGQKNNKIQQITCGSNHNMVLTQDSEAYTWGYGDMNALGHGREKDEFRPRKVNLSSSSHVRFVSAGGQHSAFIIENTKKK